MYQEFLKELDFFLPMRETFFVDRLDCLLQLRSINLGVWVVFNLPDKMRQVPLHVTSLGVSFCYDQ